MALINNAMLERHKLIRIFDDQRDSRILVVCAPAGYGKTVAVEQWLDKDTRAKAILSLDEYDNNLSGFCERFCAALRTCQPQNQTLDEIVSHKFFQKAPNEFSLRAIAALANRKQAVIVIDDLHLIHDREVLQALLVFIKRLPKNFQIVLISRHELPLGLSELWLKGQATRISADQFLFSNKDIVALYKKRGHDITDSQAKEICQKTQGWAIGLNAILLSDGRAYDRVYDYLEEFVHANIWEHWDEATREFMLHTANLRTLVPELCDEVTGKDDSSKILEELVQKGAFVTQQKRGVYRYHDLFQQFLKHMVSERGEDFLNILLEKEGYWHLGKMDFYSAVDCFIRCKSHEGIAKWFDKLDYSDRAALLASRFLTVVKNPEVESVMRKTPHLLIMLVWRSFAEGNKDDIVAYMDEYYARVPEIALKRPASAHEIFFVRILDFRVPTGQIMSESNKLTKMVSGMLNKAISVAFKKILSESTVRRWIVPMNTPMFHRGIRDFSDLAIGDTAETIDNILSKFGWAFGEEGSMISEVGKAEMFYEQGLLEQANEHAITAIAKVKSHFTAEIAFCAFSIFVCTLDALEMEDSEDVKTALESMAKIIDDNKAYHLTTNFLAFKVRRHIAAGDTKAAEDWLNETIFETPDLYRVYADITTSRALIATEQYDSAIVLLKKVLETVCAFERTLDIIETRILLAIAYWKKKRGFQDEALEHLEDAIWSAYPYGFVQAFVNDGAELSSMLHRLLNRIKQRPKDDSKPLSFVKLLSMKTQMKSNVAEKEVKSTEKYTQKQIAVMQLLCQGKTYNEMAEALGIQRSTLRNHLEQIYKKLDVTSMADAVTKIEVSGILKTIGE